MHETTSIRRATVAGMFYPDHPAELRRTVKRYLRDAKLMVWPRPIKALVVPHAGYPYSGPIAASGYAQLFHQRDTVRRVVLLGPSHHVAFSGMALPTVDLFASPLGNVPVDRDAIDMVQHLSQVVLDDRPHVREHSLEVQIPFLQTTLDPFSLVPFSAGRTSAVSVAEVLNELWGGPETLIVISSDLSHYHDDETARRLDTETSRAIEDRRWQDIDSENACGYVGLRGLLQVAGELDLEIQTLDLRNSGDTAGSRDQVVGYGAYVVF